LALISNGEIAPSESAILNRTRARERIGISGREWHDVVDRLCKDLLATAATGSVCRVDRETLARWLTEVDDAQLQRLLVLVTLAIITADGQVDAAESALLGGMLEQWSLPFDQHVALMKLAHRRKANERLEPMLYRSIFAAAPAAPLPF
jgi:hypothetical protein